MMLFLHTLMLPSTLLHFIDLNISCLTADIQALTGMLQSFAALPVPALPVPSMVPKLTTWVKNGCDRCQSKARLHYLRQQCLLFAEPGLFTVTALQPEMRQKIVICLGDSHTDATAGASFVQRLQQQNKHLQLVASGVNGEPSEIMAQRLPRLLKQFPNPVAVTILAGSNDCLEQQDWGIRLMYKLVFRISQPATQDAFVQNVANMVVTVKSTCPDAKVIVITCPPLTEQPQHPAFIRTAEYNSALKSHLAKIHPDVCIADFHSKCVQYLQDHSANSKQLQLPPVPFTIPSWFLWQPTAVFRHYLLGQSWNSISQSRGLMLLTDHVHINDSAAELVVPLVQTFLDGL